MLKNVKILFASILSVLLLLGCDKVTDTPTKPEGPAPQALLFYFVGSSLNYYFTQNINAVKTALIETKGVNKDSRIAVFRRSSNKVDWEIVEIIYNVKNGMIREEVLKTYIEPDLSNMAGVLQDMTTLVEAEKYGVVFGGHGSGWIPKDQSLTKSAATCEGDYLPFGEAPAEGAYTTRYFGETGCMFEISEISDAMLSTGKSFEYVIFDDCFMANIETLYDMRHAAKHIIASPCEIMGPGFPYNTVIPHLFTEGGTSYDLQGVCRAFHEFYSDYNIPSGCVAMTITAELDKMANVTKEVFTGSLTDYDVNSLQVYEGLSQHVFYDMMQYIEAISSDEGLVVKFREQFNKTFPEECRLHTKAYYSTYNNMMNEITYYSGITISEPSSKFADINRQTSWYKATH